MGEPHRINLSTAWLPPDPAADRFAWVRRFGRPAGVEPGDRVWLVVEAAAGCELAVAGEPLPPVAAGAIGRHDVTALLTERNELVLSPSVAAVAGGLVARHGRCDLPTAIGRVELEIEPAAHPRDGA